MTLDRKLDREPGRESDRQRSVPSPDVARARAAVHDADVGFGPSAKRTPSDTWAEFVARYGWRAWALPVLAIITVLALCTTGWGSGAAQPASHRGSGAAAAAVPPGHSTVHATGPVTPPPPKASRQISLNSDAGGSNAGTVPLGPSALPSGAPYTMQGAGTFRMLKGTSPRVGTGHLWRYSIEVENGVTGVDLAAFQRLVVSTLSDPRSWAGHHGVALERVDSGPIDFHVTLTSALTVRRLCGYEVHVETSCYAPAGPATPVNRVALNVARWVRGSPAYLGDLAAYRLYMINHEDGHALGHSHAHECLPGGLAPVMMQQTFGLKARSGQMCAANPWPYPPGAKGVPGREG